MASLRAFRRPGQRGFVLLVTILAILALTLLAHGLLALARAQRRGSGATWLASARILSASALAAEAAATLDSLPDATTYPRVVGWPGGRGTVSLRRLAAELHLVEARVDSGGGGATAGALVWAADPAVRVASLPLAAHVAIWPDAATLGRISRYGGLEAQACPPDTVPFGALRPLVALVPPHLRTASGQVPALGLLDHAEISRRLPLLPASVGTPGPSVAEGVCLTDPWNWGDLAGPPAPCAHQQVAARAAGDLRLLGGEGQGVLATAGSLTLEGTRFRGLLLVGGDLALAGVAEVEGVVVVAGAVTVGDGARLRGRPCAAYGGLVGPSAALLLRKPVVLPAPGWILP